MLLGNGLGLRSISLMRSQLHSAPTAGRETSSFAVGIPSTSTLSTSVVQFKNILNACLPHPTCHRTGLLQSYCQPGSRCQPCSLWRRKQPMLEPWCPLNAPSWLTVETMAATCSNQINVEHQIRIWHDGYVKWGGWCSQVKSRSEPSWSQHGQLSLLHFWLKKRSEKVPIVLPYNPFRFPCFPCFPCPRREGLAAPIFQIKIKKENLSSIKRILHWNPLIQTFLSFPVPVAEDRTRQSRDSPSVELWSLGWRYWPSV